MCDYCDCRSHPAIASLSKDHERVAAHLAELRRALDTNDANDAARIADDLHGLLEFHAAREEHGVFPQLRLADVDDRYVRSFEDDHDVIHDLVARCRTERWRDAAWDLISVLGAHIAREESDLFPAAHQLLTPAQWDAVDAVTLGDTNDAAEVRR